VVFLAADACVPTLRTSRGGDRGVVKLFGKDASK
jgi:hypothetical protein